jgi:hypothetical protein
MVEIMRERIAQSSQSVIQTRPEHFDWQKMRMAADITFPSKGSLL